MSEEDYILIDKLILGTGARDDHQRFQARMEDPDFRKAYEETLHVSQAIGIHERVRLKSLLEERDQKTSSKFTFLAIAASISVVVLASYFLLSKSEYEKLYGAFYEEYASLKLNRPRGASDLYTLKSEAYNQYLQGNGGKGLAEIDEALTIDANDTEAIFIRGLILLQTEDFQAAISELEKIKEVPDSRWYVALAYLGLGDLDKCKKILQERSLQDSQYSGKAIELLAKLN